MADRYIDNTKESGTLTGANWQCTNGSSTVTETGTVGNAQAELAAGDYFRTTGGTQWYRVDSVTDDDNFEIVPDFQQGNVTAAGKYNNEDGSAVNQEFPHINAATTDEGRTAGDVIRVRGGQTHVYAGIDITFDEDGTVNDYIEVRGIYTAAGDDSWGDGNVAKAIIDFDNTAFQILLSNIDYWKFTGLDITQSADGHGAFRWFGSNGIILSDCDIHDNDISGMRIAGSGDILSCTFENNGTWNIDLISGMLRIDDSTFEGGTGGTIRGIDVTGFCAITNSTFGVINDHNNADIFVASIASVIMRNVNLASATQIGGIASDGAEKVTVRTEDDLQTHLAFQAWYFTGNVTRTTAVERSGEGGTGWSMLGEPNSNCGSEQSLYIIGDLIRGIPIYLDGTEQIITVYAYADSTGGGWTPNASEFRIEIEHIEGSADWDIDVSTDTFAAEDQWEAFEITLTPNAAGFAYLRAVLNDYAAGGKIYIDPVPLIDGNRDESLIAPTVDGVGAGYEIVSSGRPRMRYHNV